MTADESTKRRYIRLLQAAGVAQAADEQLDVDALADELDISLPVALMDLEQLAVFGLVSLGDAFDSVPLLLNAGRQYLARDGAVSHWELRFLAGTIDDLLAWTALLHAGTIVVDEFRDRILSGQGPQYAADVLVPPAFAPALDERLTLDLYAASVSLMARLSGARTASTCRCCRRHQQLAQASRPNAGPAGRSCRCGAQHRGAARARRWSVSTENLMRILRALGILEVLTRALDPYESDVGRLRSDERLPQRVRPRRLTEDG